ncbi:hypothetical protein SOCE26_061620 [Sorangium cellulosum]|uniref:Activator of Hsp90 ATPase homologue 1/2-like C-terminal domain-containing protein n=1 Tax=Sorangium cellulosum TaxID=56 RepID=A0A2L0EZJ0_SORCE|nr:SRPBCC domain-containing protein [Sorangium cellulosum]AUX44695.1 hypothetical protein SOCE26_061620 [Sorangium cellulosum]
MPVRKEASGRRSVQAEAEVPGSPEEVWRAIATGPGISSWFVPSEVEEREGGTTVSHFGPGTSMDSVSTITAWDPPCRFAAESPEDMGPGTPTVATEWIVEAQSGGTCVVRVVHSWFASTDDWDNQLEGHTHGWVVFFRILRLYLSHFRGQPCTAFQLMSAGPAPHAKTWGALVDPLGLAGAAEGQRVRTADGAPPLAGVVERVGPSEFPELLLRLEEPAPGIAHMFALPMAGQIFLPIRIYLYGDQAPAAAARAEPSWQAWMAERFPAP